MGQGESLHDLLDFTPVGKRLCCCCTAVPLLALGGGNPEMHPVGQPSADYHGKGCNPSQTTHQPKVGVILAPQHTPYRVQPLHGVLTHLPGAEFVVAKAATCWPVNEASPEAVTLTISGLTAAAALYVSRHACGGLLLPKRPAPGVHACLG